MPSRRHKTHETQIQQVFYRWHPLYGKEVLIAFDRKRGSQRVVRCRVSGRSRGLEVELPDWMLDQQRCAAMLVVERPCVSWSALDELRLLCIEAGRAKGVSVVKPRHLSTNSGADADASYSSTPQDRKSTARAVPSANDSPDMGSASRAVPSRGSMAGRSDAHRARRGGPMDPPREGGRP
jgi:hypothetical protein